MFQAGDFPQVPVFFEQRIFRAEWQKNTHTRCSTLNVWTIVVTVKIISWFEYHVNFNSSLYIMPSFPDIRKNIPCFPNASLIIIHLVVWMDDDYTRFISMRKKAWGWWMDLPHPIQSQIPPPFSFLFSKAQSFNWRIRECNYTGFVKAISHSRTCITLILYQVRVSLGVYNRCYTNPQVAYFCV